MVESDREKPDNSLLWVISFICIFLSSVFEGDASFSFITIGVIILIFVAVRNIFHRKTNECESQSVETFEDGIYYFDLSMALGYLLSKNTFVLNTHWMKSDWPDEAKSTLCFAVICNDAFDVGADAEPIERDDIELLYRLIDHDENFGATAWCVHKRKEYLSTKITNQMRKSGWDFQKLIDSSSNVLLKDFRKGETRVIF